MISISLIKMPLIVVSVKLACIKPSGGVPIRKLIELGSGSSERTSFTKEIDSDCNEHLDIASETRW